MSGITLTICSLLSVEITFEALERIWEGTGVQRVGELLIVSALGLVVNMIGIFAFGHHHHGHGHSHGHSHCDSHGSSQSHSDSHGHEHHNMDCSGHSHKKEPHSHSHSHGHSHENKNMEGIYLHVLADTLGSASVVVSTILTHLTSWRAWDAIASCVIALLIALSAIPLISSCAQRLLLHIPDDTEYNLRNTLAGILQQCGVVGYSVPQFWIDDRGGNDAGDRLLGLVHVVAARGAAPDEVRDRVRTYFLQHGMDIVVQVEREGDASCWCGVGRSAPRGY